MVRLYGISKGFASFARVTAGIRVGLQENGALDGEVPVDTYDDSVSYDGAMADDAIYVGPPNQADLMTAIGWHKRRWIMLAPNSTWMPKAMMRSLEDTETITGYLAPSKWGAEVLRKYTSKPVMVYRHGISADALHKLSSAEEKMLLSCCKTSFTALHLASTGMERKGTRQLVEAWALAVRRDQLGPAPRLYLVVDMQSEVLHKWISESARLSSLSDSDVRRVSETLIVGRRHWNMDLIQLRQCYTRHHVVIQPSRGEGFGLVPLEAAACGIPVIATDATGHREHVDSSASIAICLPNVLEPIDDGPGAMAPALPMEVIYYALVGMYAEWPAHLKSQMSKNLGTIWDWKHVTERWLKDLEKIS